MSYSNYEQTVIINGYALSGVQSVDASYGITERPVKVAGVGFVDALVDAPLQGNFSISRKMVGIDPLLEVNSIGKYKFNEESIDGAIMYDNDTKGFGFTKGRVSRYSVSCTVGEIPDIQTEITVYGNLGSGVNMGGATKTHPPIQYPDQSSIKIQVSDFDIDAISDFSFSQAINTTPIYALPRGELTDWQEEYPVASNINLDPIQIDTQYPIETDINFTMIANEYEIREIKDRLQNAPKSDVAIHIFDAQNPTQKINSFTGFDMRLVSESLGSTIEGEMTLSLTYKGYETYHNPVGGNSTTKEYNVSLTGEGGTNIGGGSYEINQVVTLRAIADDGYKFSHWELIDGLGEIADPNSPKTQFVVSFDDATVRAVYDQTYLLQLQGQNGSERGAGYYEEGELVVVSAEPNDGYNFSGWNTIQGGVNIFNPSSPDQVFSMPDNPVILQANYSAQSYTITVNGTNGTQSANPSSATIGQQVTLNAVPNPGYLFGYWSVQGADIDIYNNLDRTNITGTFEMPAANLTITANYVAS